LELNKIHSALIPRPKRVSKKYVGRYARYFPRTFENSSLNIGQRIRIQNITKLPTGRVMVTARDLANYNDTEITFEDLGFIERSGR